MFQKYIYSILAFTTLLAGSAFSQTVTYELKDDGIVVQDRGPSCDKKKNERVCTCVGTNGSSNAIGLQISNAIVQQWTYSVNNGENPNMRMCAEAYLKSQACIDEPIAYRCLANDRGNVELTLFGVPVKIFGGISESSFSRCQTTFKDFIANPSSGLN